MIHESSIRLKLLWDLVLLHQPVLSWISAWEHWFETTELRISSLGGLADESACPQDCEIWLYISGCLIVHRA